MTSNKLANGGATPKRDAVRRANVARRRADLGGTTPWALPAQDPSPRSQEAQAMADGRTSTRVIARRS
jgi:hypothetical protein